MEHYLSHNIYNHEVQFLLKLANKKISHSVCICNNNELIIINNDMISLLGIAIYL